MRYIDYVSFFVLTIALSNYIIKLKKFYFLEEKSVFCLYIEVGGFIMQTRIDYNSDVFFKYVFGRNTHVSTLLRDFLFKHLLPVKVDDLSVSNPELIPQYIKDKNIILDIYINNEFLDIDIEMQKSSLSQYLYKRFQYYGAKMIASQLDIGDDFRKIKNVYQIIFIEDIDKHNPKLIERYYAKEYSGDKSYPYYVHTTIYVYLPYIEVIKEEKEVLSEIEALLYLIHKGTIENIKYDKKKGVVEMVEMLHKEFMGNRRLVEATMVRNQMREDFQAWHDMDVEEAKEEGIEEGIIKGIEEGIIKGICAGKQDMLIDIMKIKYPSENHEWIRECEIAELDKISQLLLTDISYNDLKLKMIRN